MKAREEGPENDTADLARLGYDLFFVRRVLVQEVETLSELVMSLPALRAVRAAFDGAKLALLVKADLAGFFSGIEWIDEVIPYRGTQARRGRFVRWRIARKIRRRHFDLAIAFNHSFESALWATLGRVRLRAGYAVNGRGLLLTHRATPPPDAAQQHRAQYFLRMLGDTLGVSSIPHLQEHVLDVDGRRLRKMRGWLAEAVPKRDRPLVAMAPVGEDGLATEWQPERYAALMDLLAWRHCAQTVLICPSSMTSRCRQVAAMSRCGPIIAEQDSLGDQMALLSLCDGFVGNDSGITMLAAALGIPTIAIFGSTGPAKTAPIGAAATFVYHQIECSPCGARACPYGSYNCLRWVTPYEIDDALSKLGAFDSTVRSPSSAGSGPREMRKYRSPFQDNLRPR